MNVWMGIVSGLALLYGGGELLVGGSSRLAKRLGLSPLVVALTVVAFGTSSPELAAGVSAMLKGSQELVLGNVLGSNIANLGLVLGLSVLFRPISVEREAFHRDLPVLLASSLVLALLVVMGRLTSLVGGILLLGLMGYLFLTLKSTADLPQVPEEKVKGGLVMALAGVAGGILLLTLGAGRLVESSLVLARSLGVGEHLIGLTVVALGTSLPELSSCMVAAFRGDSDFVLGNLLGSNIFNVLAILGVTSQMGTLRLSWNLFGMDVIGLVMISLLVGLFARTGFRLARREGLCLLACYGGFLAFLAS